MNDAVMRAVAWQEAQRLLFGPAQPSTRPVLLSVGSQPGAGKTMALRVASTGFYPNESFVKIIGDDLRRYHPDYVQFCASADPEIMPRETATLSAWLVDKALSYAAERGYSVAVEGTLRRPETTLATIEHFAQAGATTHLVILGVPPFDSWTGCVDRYLSALEAGIAARWTPLAAHDAGIIGTPATLDAATRDPSVHRLSIIERDGTVHYDNTRGSDGRWTEPAYAATVLAKLRTQPGDPLRRQAQVASLAQRAEALHVPLVVMDGIAYARRLVTS